MPRIDYILSQLGKAKVFSTIDMNSGYHQLSVKPEHRKYTAFITPHRGVFKFNRTPFGLSHAGDSFMYCMQRTLQGAHFKYCAAFVDDVVIYSDSWDDHIKHLDDVFRRLKEAGFTVNPDKVHIGRTEIKLLGHIISPGTCKPDPDKIRAISHYQKPKDVKSLQRFLGTVSFFRSYIDGFSQKAANLFILLRKNVKWKWESDQETAFEVLKQSLTSESCLALPKMDQEFVIHVDSSYSGIGCCLMQHDENQGLRPVAFASRVLKDCEKSFCITELETLGVVYSVQKFKQYIEHTHVTIETDHAAIKHMLNMENPSGRVRRWAMRLMGLDCTIKHRKGSLNYVADALSRAPCLPPYDEKLTYVDEILPIEDEPNTGRLKFQDENNIPKPEHSCERCTSKPKKEPKRMPRLSKKDTQSIENEKREERAEINNINIIEPAPEHCKSEQKSESLQAQKSNPDTSKIEVTSPNKPTSNNKPVSSNECESHEDNWLFDIKWEPPDFDEYLDDMIDNLSTTSLMHGIGIT